MGISMKYRRKIYRKRLRRVGRRRKVVRRRLRKGRRTAAKVYRFKRFTRLTPETILASSVYIKGFSFTLNQLPNASEFTALYQQYRVDRVTVEYLPRTIASNNLNLNEWGNMYSIVDPTTAAPLTSIDDFAQRQNVKRTRECSYHRRSFVPAVATPNYVNGLTWGYGPRWRQWLATGDASVPHYGFIIGIENRDNVDHLYDVQVTYHVSFRNVK